MLVINKANYFFIKYYDISLICHYNTKHYYVHIYQCKQFHPKSNVLNPSMADRRLFLIKCFQKVGSFIMAEVGKFGSLVKVGY